MEAAPCVPYPRPPIPGKPSRNPSPLSSLTPYALPSTSELSDAIAPYLDRYDALLLENHGALSYGHDLTSAYFKMEALDYYAKVVYLAAHYGGAKEFNAEQIERLLDIRRTKFAQPGRHPFLDRAAE